MEIIINQQFGQIGIEQKQPQINFSSALADYDLHQEMPDVVVDIDWPAVHIDLTQSLEDMGYKKIGPQAAEYAAKGQQMVMAGIERIAREGDMLQEIEKYRGTGIIAELAFNDSMQEAETNIDVIPKTPPKIWFTGGVSMDAKMGDVSVSMQPRPFRVEAERGYVKVYLEVKPSIDIEVKGQVFDRSV